MYNLNDVWCADSIYCIMVPFLKRNARRSCWRTNDEDDDHDDLTLL